MVSWTRPFSELEPRGGDAPSSGPTVPHQRPDVGPSSSLNGSVGRSLGGMEAKRDGGDIPSAVHDDEKTQGASIPPSETDPEVLEAEEELRRMLLEPPMYATEDKLARWRECCERTRVALGRLKERVR